MHIVELEPGAKAPEAADRVHINSLPNGKHGWSGAVALRDTAVFGSGKNEHASLKAALDEAVAWAASHGSTELIVETDNA